MNTAAMHAPRIPSLRRLGPWAVALALAGHLALLFVYQTSEPATGSGGGGTVLGTLSIALGSAPTPEPAQELAEAETKPTPESTVKTEQVALRKPTPPEPAKQVRQIPPKKVQAPRTKPVQPVQQAAPATPTDTQSFQSAQEATPTVGRGAVASTPGIGGASNRSEQDAEHYRSTIRAMIEKKQIYPSSARRARNQGTAVVRLSVGADGHLISVTVDKSSGHFVLDRAARRMVQRAAPFPNPPTAPYLMVLPLNFFLN